MEEVLHNQLKTFIFFKMMFHIQVFLNKLLFPLFVWIFKTKALNDPI